MFRRGFWMGWLLLMLTGLVGAQTAPLPLQVGQEAVISAPGMTVQMYSAPTYSANIVANLNDGDRLFLAQGPVGGIWWQVQRRSDNAVGWVPAQVDVGMQRVLFLANDPFLTPSGQTAPGVCTNQWFFTFDQEDFDPANPCPEPAEITNAIGQDFVGGRVLLYRATAQQPTDTIYVIYNDGSWARYDSAWNPSLPQSDPAIVPPAGRFQPVREIGYLWRTNNDVRSRLGWAYEPEQPFTGVRQVPRRPLNTQYDDTYLAHGKVGLVFRLRRLSGAVGQRVWLTVGTYDLDNPGGGIPPQPPIVQPPVQPPVQPGCTYNWFFAFDPGDADPATPCPGPLDQIPAIGQDFVGGRVLLYRASALYPSDTIYVIYNDGSWEQYPNTWTTNDIVSDPTLTPPTGRYQPVREIGKLWRENATVNTRLGWAYEPELAFNGLRQVPLTPPAGYSDTYLAHGKVNLVFRLRAFNNATRSWQTVGRYSATTINCRLRTDWPIYTVRRGDRLSELARRTNTTVNELALANCLPDPDRLLVGQALRLPFIPPDPTPIPSPTPDPNLYNTNRPLAAGDIVVGITARVFSSDEATLTVHTQPSFSAQVLSTPPTNARVDVLGGPTIAEGYRWWRIRVQGVNIEGWAVDTIGPIPTLLPS